MGCKMKLNNDSLAFYIKSKIYKYTWWIYMNMNLCKEVFMYQMQKALQGLISRFFFSTFRLFVDIKITLTQTDSVAKFMQGHRCRKQASSFKGSMVTLQRNSILALSPIFMSLLKSQVSGVTRYPWSYWSSSHPRGILFIYLTGVLFSPFFFF